MFKYSDTNKRYHTLNFFFKQKFDCKVAKISLDAGFTCPNIDGNKGVGGCIYCLNTPQNHNTIEHQFNKVRKSLLTKWGDFKCIAYFQSHTNTYAPLSVIKPIFEQSLQFDDVVGISIATRPDCLADDVVDYLAELNKKTFLTVELGLQTIHDITLTNRCHTYKDFLDGYNKLVSNGINVCIHVINGLPNETKEMMLETVRAIAELNPHSIKIHSLHILEGTKIATQYKNNEFALLTRDEYVEIVCDQLELLPSETIIQRITGDGDKTKLIAPLWSADKRFVLNSIDIELQKRDSYQGKNYIKFK